LRTTCKPISTVCLQRRSRHRDQLPDAQRPVRVGLHCLYHRDGLQYRHHRTLVCAAAAGEPKHRLDGGVSRFERRIIKTFARVFFIAPLFVLGNSAAVFPGFSAQQLQSISLILFKVNSQGTSLAMAFFGFSVLQYGYLIFRSTFLPRWLGVLGMISGLCWLTFIYPPFGRGIFVYTAIFGLLSSVAMIVRLLIGVNEERWKETAAASS
jgi:hypothetical protein